MSDKLADSCKHKIKWDVSKFKGVHPMNIYGVCDKCKTLFVKEGIHGEERVFKSRIDR